MDVDEALTRIEAARRSGDRALARGLAARALQAHPNRPDLQFEFGVAIGDADSDQAAGLLMAAAKTNATDAAFLLRCGFALIELGRSEECVQVLKTATDLLGHTDMLAERAYLQALVFLRRGQDEEAWWLLEQAVAEDTGIPGLFVDFASCMVHRRIAELTEADALAGRSGDFTLDGPDRSGGSSMRAVVSGPSGQTYESAHVLTDGGGVASSPQALTAWLEVVIDRWRRL